ncbi:MAG: hypothetical protein GPJ52_10075 [Candidatus Heimdallarchaeota archaeon]|nr:hypothetical protein [Candidatus Heimdallarchaeota archaeon]
MTRNQYCQVCGSEVLRSEKRNQKDHSKKLETKGKVLRKKLTISILAALILVSIAIPAFYVPITHRAQFPGEIEIITITAYTENPETDQLTLIMEVKNGIVSVEKLHLRSHDREKIYQSMMVKQEYSGGDFIIRTFTLQKGQIEEMNNRFSILIDYRYGKQWITYHFDKDLSSTLLFHNLI